MTTTDLPTPRTVSSGADTAAVTAVVVTYNSAAVLPGLLDSLPAAFDGVPEWRVVVVDNASSDETVHVLAGAGARTIHAGRNAGYSAAINLAAAEIPPHDHLLVLNPDVRLGPGSVARLLAALGPGVGIVVPRLRTPEGACHLSLRREPTLRRALGEAILGGARAGRHPEWGEVVADPRRYASAGSADWATGAVFLISAQCRQAVGPWDESFFLYSEETDYAVRARDLGFALRYEPAARAVHIGGEGHRSPYLWALLCRNRVRFYRRRHGRVPTLAYRAAVALGEALRVPRGPTHRAALRALLAPIPDKEPLP